MVNDELKQEYFALWSKAVARLSPRTGTLVETALTPGSGSVDEMSRLVALHREALALKAELSRLTREQREIAALPNPQMALRPSEDELKLRAETIHTEKVFDLVTALVANLGRDYTKYPDLKLIMYDQAYTGGPPRHPS